MLRIIAIVSIIMISLTAIFYFYKKSVSRPSQQPIQQSNKPSTIPTVPYQIPPAEEECIGTYLGVPTTPTTMSAVVHTSCQKSYSEEHLSFNYPCNWKIIPKVEKEISPTCGRIREFYLLPDDVRQYTLEVFPKDTIIGGDKNGKALVNSDNLKISDYITDMLSLNKSMSCSKKNLGNFDGYTCTQTLNNANFGYSFFAKTQGILLSASGGPEYQGELERIVESLKINY